MRGRARSCLCSFHFGSACFFTFAHSDIHSLIPPPPRVLQIGGFGSTLATIPLDVLVAQIQQASKAGERVSVVEQFAAQYREGGLAGIIGFSTRGFMMRAVHVALTTALMKTATSYVYERV